MNERKVSKYMPTALNADGSRHRRRVASVQRAERLLRVVTQHQGKHPKFYNEACNFSNQERFTAERFLIEDGIIVKTGNKRGSKLWLNPKTQEYPQPVKPLAAFDFDKTYPVLAASDEPTVLDAGKTVSNNIMFSGFPRLIAERCAKLEERVFYLEAALDEYIQGNLTLNQLKQVYGDLKELRD